MREFTPRPSTAGSRRGAATNQHISPNQARASPYEHFDSAGARVSVNTVSPAFIFKRAAMPQIMDWMQTSADGKERQNFKRMHDLLNIDSVPAPESITDAGVHRVAPPSSARGQELVHSDPELQKLNQGLQAINDDCYKRNLKTSYQDHFPAGAATNQEQDPTQAQERVWQLLSSILNDNATEYVANTLESLAPDNKKVCMEILQKVAAHENNCRTYKDTTYNKTFVHNPYYAQEERPQIYSNLSTALPLQKTYYPPSMEEPVLDLDGMQKRAAAKKNRRPEQSRPDQVPAMNCLAVASIVRDRWHPNDDLPDTPRHEEKEYYYGNNMLRNNHPGGPNTSYTNQACNPYTDVAAIQAQRDAAAQASTQIGYNYNSGPEEEEWPEGSAASPKQSSRIGTPNKAEGGGKPKLLMGSAALQDSSVPMDLGFAFPKTTSQASFVDPANRRFKGSDNVGTNSHNMPTASITGMAPIGLPGYPGKSGPEPVCKGFKKRPATAGTQRCDTPSMAHQDFMRRMTSSRASSANTSRSRPRTAVSRQFC